MYRINRSLSIKSLHTANCISLFNLREGERIDEVQYVHIHMHLRI